MKPGAPAPGPAQPSPFDVGQAGNVGQLVSINNQTINLGHKPEWIQALSLDDLKVAERRLYNASMRHEARAVLPLVIPAMVGMTTIWILFKAADGYPDAGTAAVKLLILITGCIIAIPVWFSLYDTRRRNREVVKVAERRWAEVIIEIALRSETKPKRPPVFALFNFFKTRLARRDMRHGHE